MRPGYLGDLSDAWFGELSQKKAHKLFNQIIADYKNKSVEGLRIKDPELEQNVAVKTGIILRYYKK